MRKSIVLAVSLLATCAIFFAIIIGNRKNERMQNAETNAVENGPVITIMGLEDIGVTITLAYPGRSWQELVLNNRSNHYLIAILIRYEFTMNDGGTLIAREVIYDPRISTESNAGKIQALLKTTDVIPPASTWLVGLGVDRVRLKGNVPSFEATRSVVSLQSIPKKRDFAKNIKITIDGVILDDGRLVGPQLEDIKQKVTELMTAQNGGQS